MSPWASSTSPDSASCDLITSTGATAADGAAVLPRRLVVSQAPARVALSPEHVAALSTSDLPVVRSAAPAADAPVAAQFVAAQFPVGEQQLYPGDLGLSRVSSEEMRHKDRLLHDTLNVARHGAEVHRQVRAHVQPLLKPGMLLSDIVDETEAKIRALVSADGLHAGVAFPTGVSLNHCAAHFAPNTGDKTRLAATDVLKLDFGVHIGGRIIDCAWTQTFTDDARYDRLLEAVAESTNAGIKAAGIDVRLCDVGAAIEEVMTSYDVVLDGKRFKVKPIRSLCGHSIEPYKIHAGKSVPCVAGSGFTERMEEGEFFAIETFGSTGKGSVCDDGDAGIFMLAYDDSNLVSKMRSVRMGAARKLLAHIQRAYGTLAFCRRWLDKAGFQAHFLALKNLCDLGIVNRCPPLVDRVGCFTAQFEHTIFLRPTCKEVLTRGDDF